MFKSSVIVAAFLAGLICGVATSGRAEDWAVSTVRSYHIERKDYEESNLGLGIETDLSQRLRLSVGVYRNSERRDSAYGVLVYCPLSLRYGSWRGCGLAGGVTGYSESIAPLAGGVLSYEGKRYGVNVIWFPNKRGDFTEGVLAFQLKKRF